LGRETMAENNTDNQSNQQWQNQSGPQGQYGGPQGQYSGPQGQYGAPVYSQAPVDMNENNLPYRFRPISMWGYFGYEILFSIPLIGLILLIVFSVGGTKNRNLRNFARSYFCFLIVAIIVIAIILAVTSTSTFFTDILRA